MTVWCGFTKPCFALHSVERHNSYLIWKERNSFFGVDTISMVQTCTLMLIGCQRQYAQILESPPSCTIKHSGYPIILFVSLAAVAAQLCRRPPWAGARRIRPRNTARQRLRETDVVVKSHRGKSCQKRDLMDGRVLCVMWHLSYDIPWLQLASFQNDHHTGGCRALDVGQPV